MYRKRRKKSPRTKLMDKLDTAWSLAVKVRAKYKSELSGMGKFQTRLNSHHFITRDVKALRYDLRNGVCIGAGEHTLSRQSAHKAPKWFEEQMLEIRPDDWNYCQEHKWDIKKWTMEEMQEELEKLNLYIKQNSQ